jgi:hypothetical protein
MRNPKKQPLKHTPGPWEAVDNFFVLSKNGKICDGDYTDEPGISFEERKANSKLIAAAPEMYKLLLLVQNWITDPAQGGASAWELQSKIEKLMATVNQ